MVKKLKNLHHIFLMPIFMTMMPHFSIVNFFGSIGVVGDDCHQYHCQGAKVRIIITKFQ